MPYIQRDSDGSVIALFRDAPAAESERLFSDHPDVLAFLAIDGASAATSESRDALATLATLDNAMIRVVEDLVDVLIQKHVIMLTDLPEKAQRKVLDRKETRLSLFGDLGDLSASNDDIL
jgi:2-oxo-4-hydroxy-4-carboxy--5-ureidoimidazoline (OHCU) decarboxylase